MEENLKYKIIRFSEPHSLPARNGRESMHLLLDLSFCVVGFDTLLVSGKGDGEGVIILKRTVLLIIDRYCTDRLSDVIEWLTLMIGAIEGYPNSNRRAEGRPVRGLTLLKDLVLEWKV